MCERITLPDGSTAAISRDELMHAGTMALHNFRNATDTRAPMASDLESLGLLLAALRLDAKDSGIDFKQALALSEPYLAMPEGER